MVEYVSLAELAPNRKTFAALVALMNSITGDRVHRDHMGEETPTR